jgi:Ca-activated chloride channel family protein
MRIAMRIRFGSMGLLCALLALAGCSDTSESAKAPNLAPPGGPDSHGALGGSGGSGGTSGFGATAGAGGASGTGSFSNPPSIGGAGGTGIGFAGAGGGFSAGDSESSPLPGNQNEPHTPVGVNPFVLVAHDPFSTFAADVDTASYDLMRRDLLAFQVPIAAGVRLEDYVNYFKYDYPAPAEDSEHPFAISLASAPHPVRDGITLLRVGIQATLPTALEKKPTNLVFLVDTSGSMQEADKLPLVQHTLTEALSVLDPNDTVSIVTYAGDVQVRLPPTHVVEAQVIVNAIQGLVSNGGTNGAGGIQLAYQQAEAGYIEGGINHVVLCTDGDFNIGVSSTDELVTMIEDKRTTGVTLTALGYGTGNLNDSMMEKVSNAGNGIYSLITSQQQANDYVENRLLSTLEHVAKDVKIQLELNPEHVHAYRLLGYENRAIADDDFRDDVIDAGEIGAGHRVTALYELVMAGGAVPEVENGPAVQSGDPIDGEREIDAESLVLVKVRYKQPGASAEDPATEVQQTLAPGAAAASLEAADADLRWAVAMAMFAELLKGSPYAHEGDLSVVSALAMPQGSRDAYRAELVTLLANYETARQ